jgi:tRNA 2-(methylsulfanyl)-N6-isopentenyladenosine37 hydroxylase
MQKILLPILNFLDCKTPQSWLDTAVKNVDLLLVDHAHCEKKAASSAICLLYRYADKDELLHKMSRIAREELRHFEMVLKILKKRNITYYNLSPPNYAKHMHTYVANHDPNKLVDTLIIGAIIEARSCERFAAVAPLLDDELSAFYLSLLKSEGRHFADYLNLAKKYANEDISGRVAFFTKLEAQYIQAKDDMFRFHSGA